MASSILSQPSWTNDLSALQGAIYAILVRANVDPNDVAPLMNQEALLDYWVPAFTHSSVDANKNYEKLEFYGDKALQYAFMSYIRQRFKNELNPDKLTLVLNKYMSTMFQAKLASDLGLDKLIRYDLNAPDDAKTKKPIGVKVREDVLEAFFGALSTLADDKIQPGLGYIYVFNLISDIFNEIPIDLSEELKHPVSQLKELFEKYQWGYPDYQTSPSDDSAKGEIKVEVRSVTGETLGVGYGSQKAAESQAAQNALDNLAKQGITIETATEEKLRRTRGQNLEFDRQYRRVEAAIAKLNQQLAAKEKVPIDKFKIVSVESRRVQGRSRQTFSIEVAYDLGDGRLVWRSIKQLTGDTPDQTRIDLMKTFADDSGIPANI